MRKLSFLFVAAALSFNLSQAADWPQFRGPSGNGHSSEKLANKDWKAKPPKELWRIKLADDGYAGLSVAADKMFVIDHAGNQDVVRAVSVDTGKDVWSYAYPDTDKDNYGKARATPTYDNGKLYVLSRLGQLTCLDAEKGTKVWTKHLKDDLNGQTGAWDYAMSPVVDGEKLIVCPGGAKGAVAALNKATGATIWQGGGTDEAGYATPVIATIEGKKQYVVFTGVAIMGVDAQTGAPLWRSPWKTAYNVNAAMPIVVGNSVFITSGYGTGCGLVTISEGKARLAWTTKAMKAHFNAPIYADGYVYGSTDQAGSNGNFACIDLKTGAAAWKHPGFETGGTLAVDGVMISVDGKTGDVVLIEINPKAYKELGRITPLGGQSWTPPALADGKLFIRNKQGAVCLDLK